MWNVSGLHNATGFFDDVFASYGAIPVDLLEHGPPNLINFCEEKITKSQ